MILLIFPDDPALIKELESSVITHLKSLNQNMEAIDKRNQAQYSDSDLELFVIIHERYNKTKSLWQHLQTNLSKTGTFLSSTPAAHSLG